MSGLGRWIRWRGLAAFAVLVAALALVWLVLVDRLVKAGIEATGTRAVGARVELDGADLSLLPAGLTLTRLQVTNPDAPMTNAVEIARVAMTLDGAMLLRRKVIVEEMAVEGVRLNTPRSRSGAVHKAPKVKKEAETRAPFGLSLPDPDALLREANLEALQAADALKADLAAFRESWERQLAELPDDADLKAYRERAQALRQAGKGGIGGLLGAAKDAKALQDDIRRDVKAVQEARRRLQSELAVLQARRKALQDAPGAEARRLVTRFAQDEGLGGALSALAFAERVGGWVDTANGWYRRLAPYVDRARGAEGPAKPPRGAGEDIRFPETAPMPDLLVRRANVSIQVAAGDLAGTVTDLTSEPAVLGRPLVFRLSGDKLRGIDRVAVEGTLDHVRPDATRDRLALTVNGYRADGLALARGGPLPLTLAKGRADLALHATVAGGEQLAGRLALGVRDANLETEGSQFLAKALQGVKAVNAQATLGGTLAHPKVDVSSDLDNVLRDVATAAARQRLETLEAEVRQRIVQRLQERLGDVDPDALGRAIEERLATRAGGLDDVLAAALKGRS